MFKNSLVALLTLTVCFTTSLTFSQDNIRLDSDKKKYSYAIGSKIGQQLLQQFSQVEGEMDLEAFSKGVNVILSGQTSQLSEKETTEIIQKKQQAQKEQATQLAKKQKAKGVQFLERNKKAKGVIVTKSGVQYKVLTKGKKGGKSPTAKDTVTVHYQGTLIDGTVFDSSYKRGEPATFPLGQVIPGWTEVVQLMKPGDKWAVVIPSELAYGEAGAGQTIGPHETLRFDIELIEVNPPQK